MKKYIEVFLSVFIFIVMTMISCNSVTNSETLSKSKQEILNTEKEFEACVKKEGMTVAFTKFAAEDAVLNRNDKLVKGKKAIKEFYESKKTDKNKLIWNADFVDVSASGDLGYTYGEYTYTIIDSSGQSKEYKGIFHTVWKKQIDGSWKYVWD